LLLGRLRSTWGWKRRLFAAGVHGRSRGWWLGGARPVLRPHPGLSWRGAQVQAEAEAGLQRRPARFARRLCGRVEGGRWGEPSFGIDPPAPCCGDYVDFGNCRGGDRSGSRGSSWTGPSPSRGLSASARRRGGDPSGGVSSYGFSGPRRPLRAGFGFGACGAGPSPSRGLSARARRRGGDPSGGVSSLIFSGPKMWRGAGSIASRTGPSPSRGLSARARRRGGGPSGGVSSLSFSGLRGPLRWRPGHLAVRCSRGGILAPGLACHSREAAATAGRML
jgi:hypothetical protein